MEGMLVRKRRKVVLGTFLTGDDPITSRKSGKGLRLGPVPRVKAADEGHGGEGGGDEEAIGVEIEGEAGDSFWQDAVRISDTLASLQLLRSRCPQLSVSPRPPPIVLQHHLYAIIKDRTQVDREVHDLVVAGNIRRFYSPTGDDDVALVFMEDYMEQLKHIQAQPSAKTKPHLFGKWIERVLPVCRSQYIMKTGLIDVLHGHGAAEMTVGVNRLDRGGKGHAIDVVDPIPDINLLVRHGLLIVRDGSSFWFGVPNGGPFFGNVDRGRDEVSRLIEKAQYNEVAVSNLPKKLRTSAFPPSFFINDLIGLGMVRVLESGAGDILKGQ